MPSSNHTSPNKNEKEANPVKYYHGRRFAAAAGAWLSAIIVLGLAAAVVAKTPASPLRSAATYNVAAAALQFFLVFFAGTKPVSESDARPSKSATVTLAFSTLIWAAAFPVMFAFRSYDDRYEVLDLNKRAVRDFGIGMMTSLENITLACGVFGCSAFLCLMFQWNYTFQLIRGSFSREHIQAAYKDSK